MRMFAFPLLSPLATNMRGIKRAALRAYHIANYILVVIRRIWMRAINWLIAARTYELHKACHRVENARRSVIRAQNCRANSINVAAATLFAPTLIFIVNQTYSAINDLVNQSEERNSLSSSFRFMPHRVLFFHAWSWNCLPVRELEKKRYSCTFSLTCTIVISAPRFSCSCLPFFYSHIPFFATRCLYICVS